MNLRDRGVTVFCASNNAARERYRDAAESLGRGLAERGATLVYGGGATGLMGSVANAALAAGGRVIGIIPRQLATTELAHSGCTELHVVETMHERKTMMSARGDAYVVLPGRYGTFEEFFEVVTWKQLGMHDKPIVLANLQGYFDPLLRQVAVSVGQGLIRDEYRELVTVAESIDEVLAALEAEGPPQRDAVTWS